MKKLIAMTLCLALALCLLAGCGSGSGGSGANAGAGGDVPSYAELKVGEDYTDLTAELRVITHRTDIIDTTFAQYVEEFNKLYPNITIKYEGITNYADDMSTRISSSSWGDICMVPTSILLPDLGLYFHPLCSLSEIENDYNFATNRAYDGVVYGIPSTGNAQGIVYNKKVAEAAGYTTDNLPKTPDEFIQFLQDIKDKTDAIPLYTNFAAGWTMTAWDAYISGGATGDGDWMNITMPQTKDPFADRGDGTGPYAVYKILYDAVSLGLTEDSPTATDWEGSKPMINNGEIGTMVLGSWAIVQMQEAGPNADDIGYMPFPITVNGTQYASAGSDYCFGVNKDSSTDNKIAAMLYIKWLSESSNFAYDQGGVPVLKSQPYPDTLAAFDGIALVEDAPAPTELASLQADVNRESELSLNADQTHVQRIVEAVITGNETLDQIIDDWNTRWNAAVDRYAPAN
ncbi:MAG: carbohydrate ABC transporter substrate-binding protein [Subdoligranulum sp.]|nr:carbohydrate ABC transporter substrate-binding protein [Subdoligranulum sp.]